MNQSSEHEPMVALTDPEDVADLAATENLLRCWVREFGVPKPAGGVLELSLAVTDTQLSAPVRYWSRTGMHRFAPVVTAAGTQLNPATLAALLASEAAHVKQSSSASIADLVGRVVDSRRRTARHVDVRRSQPDATPYPATFLSGEQSLVLGHPLHPAPLSREGLSPADAQQCSPELGGTFPLFWFAAHPDIVMSDSALPDSAPQILSDLAGAPDTSNGFTSVPAHPWQAHDLLARPVVRSLIDRGLVKPLGTFGPPWFPTTSLRTVYRVESPVMLKFSLGLRITNSLREQQHIELRRGIAVHRLLEAGLAAELAFEYPAFGVLRDPAWLAVQNPESRGETGLEVVIRDNPSDLAGRFICVAGLTAARPDLPDGRSALAVLVYSLAQRANREIVAVAHEWLERYIAAVIEPVVWLYGTYGLGLEAHQQNTLVALDEQGWPVGGRYRDNQGFYFSAERSGLLARWLPDAGHDLGTQCPDSVIDERLGYYIGINNLQGLVGALGAQRLADERDLLAIAESALRRIAARHPACGSFVAGLVETPTLRCKANMLTRVAGMDELVGPVDGQSVYIDVPNPYQGLQR